jgi:hypothetical protein
MNWEVAYVNLLSYLMYSSIIDFLFGIYDSRVEARSACTFRNEKLKETDVRR